jgi:phospholipid/cholesterol/gamma-HCH transport system permease protein
MGRKSCAEWSASLSRCRTSGVEALARASQVRSRAAARVDGMLDARDLSTKGMRGRDPTWQILQTDTGLKLVGELRMVDATPVWKTLRTLAGERTGGTFDIDLTDAVMVDGAIMSLLVELRAALSARNVHAEIVGASERLKPIVHLYRGDEPPRPKERTVRETALTRIGMVTAKLLQNLRRLMIFLGETVAATRGILGGPAGVNWRSIPTLTSRAGADGIPIVLLLNFLVGFVMGFQSARQLKIYGANIYVADVVGISVTRELAPLMTAIIMSGRSGASFAAELGSMRVSEEIDALKTMGFSPAPYLILPRVAALALVAPVLTLLGAVVGVAGGAAVAVSSLDVSARGYLAELRTALVPSDIWTGLVKSVAFGIAIAFIGCQQGFATRGAAEGVGRSTTTTVVSCLFAIVIIDTLFTVFFQMLGK